MPVQIPGQQQTLQGGRLAVPLVAPQGQGAKDVAQGLGNASRAAQGVDEAQFQQQQAADRARAALYDEQQKAAAELKKKKDATAVFQAETATQDLMRQYMQSVQETKRGSSADGATSEADAKFQEFADQISETLENPEMQALYHERFNTLRNSALNTVSAYEAKELNSAALEAADGKIKSSVAMGAMSTGNIDAMVNARKSVIEAVSAKARFAGWEADKTKEERLKELTQLHTQIIETYAAKDPAAAQAYFTLYKSEIDGAAWKGLETTMKTSYDITEAQNVVDTVLYTSKDLKLDRDGMRAAVKEKLTGKAREDGLNILDDEFKHRDAAVAAQDKANEDAAWKLFDVSRNVATAKSKDPVLFSKISGKTLQIMEDLQKTPQERVQTNYDTYMYLSSLAGTNPQAFMAEDLNKYRGLLNAKEMDGFLRTKQSIAADAGKSAGSLQQRLDSASEGLSKEQAASFMIAVRDEMDAQQGKAKAPLTVEQEKKIINDMRVKVAPTGLLRNVAPVVGGIIKDLLLGQPGTTVGSQIGEVNPSQEIHDMPQKDKDRYAQLLKSRGVDVNDENILYLSHAEKGK